MLASENGFGGHSAYWDDATVSLDEKVGYRDFGNPYCIVANETKLTVPKASKFSILVPAWLNNQPLTNSARRWATYLSPSQFSNAMHSISMGTPFGSCLAATQLLAGLCVGKYFS